ncbi:MAG: murein transglycosylase A [Steroidobacter sp.]
MLGTKFGLGRSPSPICPNGFSHIGARSDGEPPAPTAADIPGAQVQMTFTSMSMPRSLLALATLTFLHGCVTQPQQQPEPIAPSVRYDSVRWSQLPGWEIDQAHEAWSAFLQSCNARNSPAALQNACGTARSLVVTNADQARSFFEVYFAPYHIVRREWRATSDTGLITGYYEPLLHGSRKPSVTFATALYAPPNDMLTIELGDVAPELQGKRVRGRLQGKKVLPYYDRAALQNHPSLKGKELVWVDSAVDAFFLEVQGSGRVQLDDGSTIRLAYADQNGQPYRSIGRYLVDTGEMSLEASSAPTIRRWMEANPSRLTEVLNANPSVVFFREERIDDPSMGPKGSLGVPLTAGRSVAIDPNFIPLGAPLFLSMTYPTTGAPLQRLVMAQDTGGAIRGPVRADLFSGFGASAGESAGLMKQQGQLWLLWPKGAPLPNAQTSSM